MPFVQDITREFALNHWRNGNGENVHMNMSSHMTTGVGRFFTEDLFYDDLYNAAQGLRVGEYVTFESNRDLRLDLGASKAVASINFFKRMFETVDFSEEIQELAYVWNQTSAGFRGYVYKISENQIAIDGEIRAFTEDFDFRSDPSWNPLDWPEEIARNYYEFSAGDGVGYDIEFDSSPGKMVSGTYTLSGPNEMDPSSTPATLLYLIREGADVQGLNYQAGHDFRTDPTFVSSEPTASEPDDNVIISVPVSYEIRVVDGLGQLLIEPENGAVEYQIQVERSGEFLPSQVLYLSTLPGSNLGVLPSASASADDYIGMIGSTEQVLSFSQGQRFGYGSVTILADSDETEEFEVFRVMLRDDLINTSSGALKIQELLVFDPENEPTDGPTQPEGPADNGTDEPTVGDPSVGTSNGVEIRIVGVSTVNPNPGGSASVSIEVENIASGARLVGSLGIYFSEDDNPSRSELVGTYTPGVVNSGETVDRRVDIVIPDGASGLSKIIVVDEDELNDPAQMAIADFDVATPSSRADLKFDEHYLYDSTLTYGQQFEVEYTVKNIGQVGSGRSDVSFYLSTNRTFNEDDDLLLGNEFFGTNRNGVKKGIDAGERDNDGEMLTITAEMVQSLRGDLMPTNLYLLYVIDEDREIDDADRSNNVTHSRFSIAATEDEINGYTDHSVTDFAISTDRIIYGDRVYFDAIIENVGTIDANFSVQDAEIVWRNVSDGSEQVRGGLFTDSDGIVDTQYERNVEYFSTYDRSISDGDIPVGEYEVFARTRPDENEPSERLANNESNAVRVFVGGPNDVPTTGNDGADVTDPEEGSENPTSDIDDGGVTPTQNPGDDLPENIPTDDLGSDQEAFPISISIENLTNLDPAQYLDLAELYSAYYNRAPDVVGLAFWANAYGSGVTLDEIAEYFFDQDEVRFLYPDQSDQRSFIEAIYQNVFGREPDALGLAFWTEVLAASEVTVGKMVQAMLAGAKNNSNQSDANYMRIKAELGLYFAAEQSLSDVSLAREVFATLGSPAELSVSAAVNMIDQAQPDMINEISNTSVLALSDAVDISFPQVAETEPFTDPAQEDASDEVLAPIVTESGVTPPYTSGDDHIIGTPFDDTLLGGGGTDTLIGGDGNDVIDGQFGGDYMVGGQGSDRFVISNGFIDPTSDGPTYGDEIADFTSGEDVIEVLSLTSYLGEYSSRNAGVQSLTGEAGEGFLHVYEHNGGLSGRLWVDANGDGILNLQENDVVVWLTGVSELNQSDFGF